MNREKFMNSQFIMVYGEPFMWIEPVESLMRSKTIKSAIANGGRFAVNMNTKKFTVLSKQRIEEALKAYGLKKLSFSVFNNHVGHSIQVETVDELVKHVLDPKHHGYTVLPSDPHLASKITPVMIDFMIHTPRYMTVLLTRMFNDVRN